MPSLSTHLYRICLLGLLLAAFALRVYKLDSQSLWYDEGVTAIVAQYDLASLSRWTADDIQPPLYYALTAGWGRLAGWSEWSLRFLSVWSGLLVLPLMAVLARRWSGSRLAGLLAGLLAATHPLLVYYSQEARMYSLLVALGTAIAYCVLRIGVVEGENYNAEAQRSKEAERFDAETRRWRAVLWGAYVAAAVAALYTHYFAAFLLLAVNIAYLLQSGDILRNTQHAIRNRLPWLLANAAVLLLYLPWIGNLFTRLDVDASYWEGAFKLWEALTAIAIRFTSGETVLEGEATRLLWMYGAVTLLALAGLAGGRSQAAGGRSQAAGGRSQVADTHASRFTQYAIRNTQYPLLLLFVPVLAVLTLASFTPKFNARYVMVALPGLLLIWSVGLAGLLEPHPSPPQSGEGADDSPPPKRGRPGGGVHVEEGEDTSPPPKWGRLGGGVHVEEGEETAPPPKWGRLGGGLLAGLVGLGLLLAGFAHANDNWFHNNAFTKDQWRELVSYIQGQYGERDAVVLVSGHAWPVWRYYAPEIEPVRLPEIEILDVNAVVDLDNSTAILRPALEGKEWAWLVNWQEEVIDPTDVAGLQLGRAGVERSFDAQFWGLHLRRYAQVDARAISNAPPIQQPVYANFGDVVELLGYSVEPNGDLLLFWRLNQPGEPLPDLYLTGETRTAEGLLFSRIGDRRLSAYDFPTFRWQVGQIVAGRIPVNEWIGAGAPPGNYHLRLGVYDPAEDGSGLDLLGENGARLGKRITVEIGLGQSIPLAPDENPLSWHPLVDGLFVRPILVNSSAPPGGTVLVQVLWYAPAGQRVDGLVAHWNEQGRAIQWDGERATFELSLAPEQAIRTVHQIAVPLDLPPGDYWLELTAPTTPTRPVELPVRILPDERQFTLPPLAAPVQANFGGVIGLAGFAENEPPARIEAGEVLPLHFVWRTLADTDVDYTMSLQWLNGDGLPASQVDEMLPRGSSAWLPDEVVSQIIKTTAPDAPGDYRLIVAVYDANRNGLPRLLLPSGEDFVEVARVRVLPDQP